MSKGASNGEVSAACAEPKERLAASNGVAGAWATRSGADSSAFACCTSARPWLALESPEASSTAARASQTTTRAAPRPTRTRVRRDLRLHRRRPPPTCPLPAG